MFKKLLSGNLILIAACCLPAAILAQNPPATDIYLASLSADNQGNLSVGQPRNITNRPGYDNQPAFRFDGKALFYTSALSDGQTDIYQFDLFTGTAAALTRTPESEYSPTPTPDGQHFSVVRVELDTALVQRLWQFPISGGEPSLLIKNINPVGYHAWGNEKTLILFVLGEPPTLQMAHIKKGAAKAETVVPNGGRSLHKIPGKSAFSFVHKTSEDEWWVKSVDMKTLETSPLVKTLAKSEDYVWTPGGQIIMGQGAKLFACDPVKSDTFTEIANFEKDGLKQISRLAVSPDGNLLALVSAE